MNRDFTLAKYEELCSAIVQSGYAVMSVKDYLSLSLQPPGKVVILRHDVDRKPEKSTEKMAEIERDFGISSTYYFRSKKEVFKAGIIQAIEKMGHEVGYHYKVLDKAKGNKLLLLKKGIFL
jgi:predicted DNA-binding transcriptional regulator